MQIIQANCPSCSAPLTVHGDQSQMTCAYCNTPLFIHNNAGHLELSLTEQVQQITAAVADEHRKTREQAQLAQSAQQAANDRQLSMTRLNHVQDHIQTLIKEGEHGDAMRKAKAEEYKLVRQLGEHAPPTIPVTVYDYRRGISFAIITTVLILVIWGFFGGKPNLVIAGIIGIGIGAFFRIRTID